MVRLKLVLEYILFFPFLLTYWLKLGGGRGSRGFRFGL